MIRCRFPMAALFALSLSIGPARAEPLSLSYGEAREVLSGLLSLSSGQDAIVKEGERERVVRQPLKGVPVGVLLAIAKDIGVLQPVDRQFMTAMSQRRMALQSENGTLSVDATRTLTQEIDTKQAEQQPLDLVRVKISDLHLEQNPVSPVVLSQLAPLLIDDGSAGAK